MKLSCLQENLARALGTVGRAVAGRNATLPVTQNILLATDNGRLRVCATNLELGVNCWIGAKIEDEGAITVPARPFTELISLLPSDRVDIDLNVRTQTVRVRGGRADTNIKGIDAQEFPIVPVYEPNGAFEIDAAQLKRLISRTVFATATDEARLMLTGVLMKFEADNVTLFASDGFRLSKCKGKLKTPTAQPVQALVPAKTMQEVARILGDQEDPVAISITPARGQILFHLANVDVNSGLVDQKFPEVEALIPLTTATTTIVNTADLLKAAKQASIFARDASDIVKMQIAPGEDGEPGKVTMTARADETGDNKSELDAAITGSGLEIGFNVRFVVDLLSVMDAPQVSIATNTPRSSGLFMGVGDDTFQHIIMPINLPKSG